MLVIRSMAKSHVMWFNDLKNGYGDDSVTVQSERVQITLSLP